MGFSTTAIVWLESTLWHSELFPPPAKTVRLAFRVLYVKKSVTTFWPHIATLQIFYLYNKHESYD